MLWFIPIFAVWLPILYRSCRKEEGIANIFFMFIINCFVLIPMTIIGLLPAFVIGSMQPVVAVEYKSYPLVALSEKDGMAGRSYFLGEGSIADQQYYFWYRKNGDYIQGGKTIREPYVRIFEDNSQPRLVTFTTAYKSTWWAQNGWLFGIDIRSPVDIVPDFYIPPGSIKEGFSL